VSLYNLINLIIIQPKATQSIYTTFFRQSLCSEDEVLHVKERLALK